MTFTGIDTRSIISQLMNVERIPQQQLQARISQLTRTQAAWSTVAARLKAVSAAASKLTSLGAFGSFVKVASSNEEAAAVRPTGSPSAGGAVSFTVVSLATAQVVSSDDLFVSRSADTTGRSVEIAAGGTTRTFTGGTLTDLAAAINDAAMGVSAQVLQVADSTYRLQLTATGTGTASAFSVAATGFDGFSTTRAASDATLDVGGVLVSRPSNTVSDLLDGAEITLRDTTGSAVTVSAVRDDDQLVAAVKNLVGAAQAALADLVDLSKASDSPATRGVLAGNSTIRSLQDQVRGVVAAGLTGADGTRYESSLLGVSLDRAGNVTFDEAALRASLATNSAAVEATLGRAWSSTIAGVSVVGVTSASTPEARALTVTQAATVGVIDGVAVPLAPPGAAVTVQVQMNGAGPVPVSFTVGGSWSETAAAFSNALRAAGITGLEVESDGTRLTVKDRRYGSANSFTIVDDPANPLGVAGTASGTDAHAMIGGTVLVGSGQHIHADGVVYKVELTQAALAGQGGTVSGTVAVADGFAGALARVADQATGTGSGAVVAASDSTQARIADLNRRVARFDQLLEAREQLLVRRFTVMEQLIARLQAQQTTLGGLMFPGSAY